ncbi:MAG: flagellar hook assembly protein FlgD [Proteobacteria bacterium]|nr:flagellar hook assembly protein FlgD [Pseudomonadota bacterium]MDA1308315.1 flagellar hook assembly protein FlgD [Pseudomonadota bacterium]
MQVAPLSTTSTASGTALSGLNTDFETFLNLLTTQLQNQDPTSPMDTNEMTAQLVQFAGVEQQIAQNKNLEALVKSQNTNADAAAVSYIGHEVQVEGNTTDVTSAGTTWGYEFGSVPQTVTLNVLNAAGALVYSETGETVAGSRHAFNWNLTDSSGGALAPGKYTMNVSALDANGDPITASVDSTGLVSGVKSTDSGPALLIGDDITVTLAQIMKIQ